MTTPKVSLARAEAFLESAIGSRTSTVSIVDEAGLCEAAGERDVAAAIMTVAEMAEVSAPAATRAAARALGYVRYRRAVLRTEPPPVESVLKLGSLRLTPDGAAKSFAIADIVGRRGHLAQLAATDSAELLRYAPKALREAEAGERSDIAWSLGFVTTGVAEATRLLLGQFRLGRATSDSLARLGGIGSVLRETAGDASGSPAVRACAAASLIRRREFSLIVDLEPTSDHLTSAIAAVARALESGGPLEIPGPGRLRMGLEAWLKLTRAEDSAPLETWVGSHDEPIITELGRVIAGWPREYELIDFALVHWRQSRPRERWAALVAGIDAPGVAGRLEQQPSPESSALISRLGSIDARLVVLDRGDHDLADPHASDHVIYSDSPMGRAGSGARGASVSIQIKNLVAAGGEVAARELGELAGSNNPEAARALTEIADPAARRTEELMLVSAYPDVAAGAAWAVAQRGSAGIRYGEQLLRSGNDELVGAGLRILANGEIDRVRDALLKSMRGSNMWTVRQAVEAAARAGAGTADRRLARAVLAALKTAAGGAMVVVPALESIGHEPTLALARGLNDNGHLFDSGRDDEMFDALIESGREILAQEATERERRRIAVIDEWRMEGRLVEHSRGRAEVLLNRFRRRRTSDVGGSRPGRRSR